MDYGFGAVFGCPAHDQRDLDFALKYKLKITPVVRPFDENENFNVNDEAYTGPGIIFNSKFLNDLKFLKNQYQKQLKLLKIKELVKKNKL